jgi:hypothetical protein
MAGLSRGRPGRIHVVGTDAALVTGARDRFDGRVTATSDGDRAQIGGVLWIRPDVGSWKRDLPDVLDVVPRGGRLAIIGGGPLEWPRSRVRRSAIVSADAEAVGLTAGLDEIDRWRLVGPASTAMAVARLVAGRLGRDDLQDRFEAAYRERLLTDGPVWTIGVWLGQRR